MQKRAYLLYCNSYLFFNQNFFRMKKIIDQKVNNNVKF